MHIHGPPRKCGNDLPCSAYTVSNYYVLIPSNDEVQVRAWKCHSK